MRVIHTSRSLFAVHSSRRARSYLTTVLLWLTLQPLPVSAAGDNCTLAQMPGMCTSTLIVALRIAHGMGYAPGDSRRETITIENDFADGPTKSEVTIEQHGVADDSVQALRFVVRLAVAQDGGWKTVGTERSWKCWPGRGPQSFGSTLCR